MEITQVFSSRTPPCRVLDGVTFSIPSGQVVGLLGESGSGKTTLLKLIAGRIRPSSGSMTVCGKEQVGGRQDPSCHLSLVDGQSFDPDKSIHENYLGAPKIDPRLLDQALTLFGIIDHADERVEYLPQTAVYQAELAAGFSSLAPVLLVDALHGFDREAARTLSWWLPDRAHEADQAVVIATRDPGVVLALCDRVLVLRQGRIVLDSLVSDLVLPAEYRMYEFQLRGCLEPARAGWFESFRMSYQSGNTLLTGEVVDQAHLNGILARIRDLGLPIESFRRLSPDAEQTLRDAMGGGSRP